MKVEYAMLVKILTEFMGAAPIKDATATLFMGAILKVVCNR